MKKSFAGCPEEESGMEDLPAKTADIHNEVIDMLISAKDLNKRYTDRKILDNQSFSIEEGDRIGLIGVNGSGKSTLLKILAGEEDAEGEILKSRELKMAVLHQEPSFHRQTVMEELKYRNSLNKTPAEEFQLKAIATKLELPLDQTPIETLSGGMKRRLDLASVLISDANLLLLDEPTNHLDNSMIDWLEGQLNRSKAAVVMITHDRYFLERVTNRILELDHGRLFSHDGGYETYLENKAERESQAEARQKKLKNLYRSELEWVRAGVQARGTKQKGRLQRFEELRKQRQSLAKKKLEMTLASARLGKKTLSWEDVAFGYEPEKPLFHDFSYQMKRTDRIGLIGPNGCGKTTFLKLLNQEIEPDAGKIEWGETLRIGYFQQNMQMEDLSMRVIDYIEEQGTEAQTDAGKQSASALLEQFLFDRDMFYMPLSRLSGGERRRAYLLKVLMQAPNLLILDEPTNDLDLVTLEILEEYLDSFPGIVVSVSHDRSFLDRVCDYLFVWQPDHTFRQYPGGYSEMLIHQEEEKKEKSSQKKENRRRKTVLITSAERRELASLEKDMEEIPLQIEACNQKMAEEGLGYEEVEKLAREVSRLEEELASREERWMELEAKREEDEQSF